MDNKLPRLMPFDEILDFLVLRLDKPMKIQASSDAVESFRAGYETLASNQRLITPTFTGIEISFEVEPNPYRHNGAHYILPLIIQYDVMGDRVSVGNPDWEIAPYELVIGYGVGGLQAVSYKRDFKLQSLAQGALDGIRALTG